MYYTIDLCAGIGGIRRGFELTGEFSNVLSAEIDDSACKTYEHLFHENPKNDVTSEDFKNLVCNTRYDILLAGFPCQAFSRAGLERGFEDEEKGVIFIHLADIIERSRPKGFFLENVDNLIRHDNFNTFRTILETLEVRLNYKVIGVSYNEDGRMIYDGRSFVRNSRNFGVPQNRPRTYIIGFDRERYGHKLDGIKNDLPLGNELHIYGDLNDLLEMQAPAKYYMSSGYLHTLVLHRERERQKGHGFGFIVVNRPGVEHPIANTIMATGGSGKERNLVYDPQDGIAGQAVKGKYSPLNDECIRVMTPREWGKLQGFINYAFIKDGEDTFSFPDDMKDGPKYKQFGNSVTIPVIETMAKFMLDCLQKIDN